MVENKFELHLRNLLNQQFGEAFVTSKVQIRFHEVEGKEVCQVEVSLAKEPKILTLKDKSGQTVEKFTHGAVIHHKKYHLAK